VDQQFCTFYLADRFYGVEVDQVQEVIREQSVTRVPLAASVIGGLINLRGQIVTAFDLRERLGLPARTDGQVPTNVVVRYEDEAVSLLVDEIGDVVEIDEHAFEPPPDTLSEEARALTRGVYKLTGKLMHVLDLAAALSSAGSKSSFHNVS
jgi:purine-binding chemotaxis protein CheW